MKTFNSRKQISTYAPSSLWTSILGTSLTVALAAFSLMDCSGKTTLGSGGDSGRLQLIQVPVSVARRAPQAQNLELAGGDLELLSTASALKVEVTGCASGYRFNSTATPTTTGTGSGGTITSVINLYNGDQGCIITLHAFTDSSGGFTYLDTNNGGIAWSPALAAGTGQNNGASVATFSKVASGAVAGDLIKVFLQTQVTNPVTNAAVSFQFTDIAAGATNTLSQSSVSTAVPLSVTGKAAPNYAGSNDVTTGGVAFARYLSTNTNGSGNMSFTIACHTAVTGTTPNFSCVNTDTFGDIQSTQISYAMVPDNYNACITTSAPVITVAQANAIFAGTTGFYNPTVSSIPATASTAGTLLSPGTVGQIAAAGADNSGNSGITNGGFDTVSMLTGGTAIYSSPSATWTNGYQYLNDVLMVRRTDTSSNTLSYLYWCINIAAITQE